MNKMLNKSFELPSILDINENDKDILIDAINELREMENNYCLNNMNDRQIRKKIQLKKKFLQKYLDAYNRLHPTMELFL